MKSVKYWMVGLVLAGLLLAGWQTVTAEEEYDFRKTRWGMSMIEVKAIETEPMEEMASLLAGNNRLIYQTKMLDHDWTFYYEFENNALVKGEYYLGEQYKDLNEYVRIFYQIREELLKRHGKPIKDKLVKRFPDKKINKEDYGKEIARQNLRLYMKWIERYRKVYLILKANDRDMILKYAFEKLN